VPCDSIQVMGVKLAVADLDLFVAGLKELGYANAVKRNTLVTFGLGESFDKATGELQVRATTDVARIRKSYASQVALAKARKFGWQVRKIGEFQYELAKR
jgi:hypothetical protein